MRFHTQTGGSTLTAQQPENNIVRTTVQALAAVLGGTQSLHTNSYDEALGLPTEKSAEIALRTQQILAFESGVADTVDPLAGSYYMEYLMEKLEKKVGSIMEEIEKMGGSVNGINSGYFKDEIAHSAYDYQKKIEHKQLTVIGVNRFQSKDDGVPEILKVDRQLETQQVQKLKKLKQNRDNDKVDKYLKALRETARTDTNIVESVLEAVENYATVGEISNVFREVWGEYHESNL